MFRSCLLEHVLPSVRFLELSQLTWVPIFTIFRSAPRLRHIHIGADYGLLSSYVLQESSTSCLHSTIASLSVGPFNCDRDFQIDTTLGSFVKLNGKTIRSLHFESYSDAFSLSFLSSCPTFTEHLLHFSAGIDLFDVATIHQFPDLLPLTMCPRLETLSFAIFFPYDSSVWFNWMAKCLRSATLSPPSSPLPLKKIYSTISYRSGVPSHKKTIDSTINLDDFAMNSQFDCSMEFSVPVSNGNEILQSVFADLRGLFPSCDQAGRLKLWVEM
ncbi:hypothetical protein DL96DRAFT_1635935 [Flagelloscypha sp. PMI_526]|nr:hypothetical protein DL96DRAFT_1635935 [Flagelloscypha sp. PMI_526]